MKPALPADFAFIEATFFATQRWLIEALFGWRGDALEREKFSATYDESSTSIIEVDGVAVGWMAVERRPEAIELHSIYLIPAAQRHGTGSSILRDLMAQSRAAGKPLKLSTAKINPAARLYERLGFTPVGSDEYKVFFEFRPSERVGFTRRVTTGGSAKPNATNSTKSNS